jgi:UTP--glucose-1-phosphate uridylyltransferase
MINKCLFPAAGYGTRFLPATKAIPKEMLPILTKPLLQFGVEEAISANINHMSIVTGRGKRSIEDHFDNSFEIESQLKGTNKEHLLDEIIDVITTASFSYIRQRQMLGLGHAILTGQPLIGNEPFAVILADDLCINYSESVLSQMMNIYKEYKCPIVAFEEVPQSKTHLYGIISGEVIDEEKGIYRVKNMTEKPKTHEAKSNKAIIGRYILTPEIFDILKNLKPGMQGEIQITDALMKLAKKNKVLAYRIKGRRFDCGGVEGYVNAINYLAKRNKIL